MEDVALSRDGAGGLSRAVSLEVGTPLEYEGRPYTVALVGEGKVLLQGTEGTSEVDLDLLRRLHAEGRVEIQGIPLPTRSPEAALNTLGPRALEAALERADWLELAKVDPARVPRTERTLRRYRKAIREAGEDLVEGHLALATKYANCGNRQRKIPQAVIEAIDWVAREHYNKPKNITKAAAYMYLLSACEEAGVRPCSARTFYKELDLRRSVRAQKGKRWAYQTDPIVWYLHLQEPIHGTRPFECVHIDHTELDVVACSTMERKSLGRVWLSLAVDAESRAVLGFYLSFEKPSYRSCMMVLRDIVRRHGRMPEMLVVDNGKDFHSRALKRVCHLYGCSIRYRPAGYARHGSVLERLFGTVNTQFIHLLEGNTQLMKYARSVTKTVMPENFVRWTLPQLHGALDYFFNRIYGADPHPAHGDAPLEHFERRMAETGARRNRLVRFDETFRIETCPSPVDKDTREVDRQRGIKVNHIWFWNDMFRKPGMDGQALEVRVDPWDVRYVYVLVEDRWHVCTSKLLGILRDCTEVELRYAMAELVARHRLRKKDLSPERLAEWLRMLDATAFSPDLAEQQSQAKTVYAPLGMTAAAPPEAEVPVPALARGRPDVPARTQAPPLLNPVPMPQTASGPVLHPTPEPLLSEPADEYALF